MRLYSSRQVTAALERLGCFPRYTATGSRKPSSDHCVYTREVTRADGRVHRLSAPVVMGKREIARGTLRSILEKLEIPEEEFEKAVR